MICSFCERAALSLWESKRAAICRECALRAVECFGEYAQVSRAKDVAGSPAGASEVHQEERSTKR